MLIVILYIASAATTLSAEWIISKRNKELDIEVLSVIVSLLSLSAMALAGTWWAASQSQLAMSNWVIVLTLLLWTIMSIVLPREELKDFRSRLQAEPSP